MPARRRGRGRRSRAVRQSRFRCAGCCRRRWNAGGILLACLFFGFCDALQIRLQVSGIAIPYQFFQMIPYVATVVVLTLIGARQAGPKANGKPYRREQR